MTEAAGGGWAKWRIWLIAAGAGLISLLLFEAFRVLLGEVHYADVMQQMASEPWRDLLRAGLATAVSYLMLTACYCHQARGRTTGISRVVFHRAGARNHFENL